MRIRKISKTFHLDYKTVRKCGFIKSRNLETFLVQILKKNLLLNVLATNKTLSFRKNLKHP